MTPGKLYTYGIARRIFSESKGTEQIGEIEGNEPFLFLGDTVRLKWVETFKVLSSKGIVGWIQVGYPESIKVFGEANG